MSVKKTKRIYCISTYQHIILSTPKNQSWARATNVATIWQCFKVKEIGQSIWPKHCKHMLVILEQCCFLYSRRHHCKYYLFFGTAENAKMLSNHHQHGCCTLNIGKVWQLFGNQSVWQPYYLQFVGMKQVNRNSYYPLGEVLHQIGKNRVGEWRHIGDNGVSLGWMVLYFDAIILRWCYDWMLLPLDGVTLLWWYTWMVLHLVGFR